MLTYAACVAFADAMLKRSGKRFAVLTILRNVGAVFKAWLQAAKEGRYFSRGMAKLGARQDLVFVAEHFSAWRVRLNSFDLFFVSQNSSVAY